MKQPHRIALIPGDGIGTEVIAEARRLLDWYRTERGLPLDLWDLDLGAERYLRDGTTFPAEISAELAQTCRAVVVGALGDPRIPDSRHARDILFGMRFGFDLYSNFRPVRALADRLVPLAGRKARDVDFVVFRENTEGVYVNVGGQLRRGTPDEIAINEDINTRKGVERIIRAAFEYARAHGKRSVHMADKSNAMRHAHELWLRVFDLVRAEYPEIRGEHLYIDALCMFLVRDPSRFEVIVTNNLFGDIVTDIGAAFQGGLGMAASANTHPGDPTRIALFEPVHGSAPDIAGKGIANPFASLLCVGQVLTHLGFAGEEARIERAIVAALDAGICTPDVGGKSTTREAAAAVLATLASSAAS